MQLPIIDILVGDFQGIPLYRMMGNTAGGCDTILRLTTGGVGHIKARQEDFRHRVGRTTGQPPDGEALSGFEIDICCSVNDVDFSFCFSFIRLHQGGLKGSGNWIIAFPASKLEGIIQGYIRHLLTLRCFHRL